MNIEEERRAISAAIAREFGGNAQRPTRPVRTRELTRAEIRRAVAQALGNTTPEAAGATRTVTVWRSVSFRDVLIGHDAESIGALGNALAPLMEYVADFASTPEQEVVFAMCSPSLPVDEREADWYTVFAEQGVEDQWLPIIERLRVRSHPEFAEVFDVDGAAGAEGTFWERDAAGGYQLAVRQLGWESGRLPAYRLPLTAHVPIRESHRKVPQSGLERRLPPVWPYPLRPEDAAAVSALAKHLSRRVEQAFNGRSRLLLHPVLAPLCAMAATVDAAMMHPGCRTKHHATRPRWGALKACLDALELGPHLETAERLLVRDHPRHIHVDASATPTNYTIPRWRRGLGLFASGKDGLLREVSDLNRDRFEPRILHCLSAPEPL